MKMVSNILDIRSIVFTACITITLCIPAGMLIGQQSTGYIDQWMGNKTLLLGGSYRQEIASNGISTAFFKDYINGRFLTEERKEESIKLLDEKNEAGLSYAADVFASIGLRQGYKLYLCAGFTSYNEVQYHKDMFVLYFKGNKAYEGKTANLLPFGVEKVDYSFFKFGISKAWKQVSFFGAVGLISGIQFFSSSAQRGTLFTAVEGRYIDLDVKLESADWTGSENLFYNSKALGLAIDAGLSWQPSTNTTIQAKLSNYGSISWNGGVRERFVDTVYRYEGIEIDNLLDTFSLNVKDVEDLESDFLTERNQQNRKLNIPYNIFVRIDQFFWNRKWHIAFEAGKFDSKFSNPYFVAELNHLLSNQFSIGLRGQKFSYTGFDAGIQMGLKIGENIGILAHWDSVTSLLNDQRALNWSGGLEFRVGL